MLLLAAGLTAAQDEPPVVFKSDVSLVRVDVRATGAGRAVSGLTVHDFLLSDNGKPQPIRSFSSEEMPLDVLFLIDVSGSMQSHVERLASAAQSALATLTSNDRVGVMVFDRSTRLRLKLTSDLEAAERDLRGIIHQEGFNGGTDITRALLEAARLMGRDGRKDARRAIIILTDDRTEREREEFRVQAALTDADTVLSALIAPDAIGMNRRPPGSVGDIIFGRRMPRTMGRSRTQSAGTPEIARGSGGDSMPVDHASALQATLDGIRQRYSLYFSVPAGAEAGQLRRIQVELSPSARRRYPSAELQFRADYRAPGGGGPREEAETVITQAEPPQPERPKRRPAGETYESRSGPNPKLGGAPAQTSKPAAAEPKGGWRKATSGDYEAAEKKPPA